MRKEKASGLSNIIKYLPVLIILLSITIIIGSTFAYFTDSKETSSNLTFSKVELSNETSTGVNGKIMDAIPGSPLVNGVIEFSKSIDSENIYVRAKLSFSSNSTNPLMETYLDKLRDSQDFGIVTTLQNGAVWSEKQGNYFYLLNEAKDAFKIVDDIFTYKLTDNLVVPRDLENLPDNAQYMEQINFHVAFEAIQAYNVTSDMEEIIELFNLTFPESEDEKYEVDNAEEENEELVFPEYMTFSGNVITGYYGTESKVYIPSSYSLTGNKKTVTKEMTYDELVGWCASCSVKEAYGVELPYPYIMTTDVNTYTITNLDDIWDINRSEVQDKCTISFEIDEAVEGDDYEVTEISGGAFYYEKAINVLDGQSKLENLITEIVIADGIEIIGDCAFMYQFGLKRLTLPNTLKSIGQAAFVVCNIISLEIPSSVITIADDAFDETGILEIINHSNVELTGDNLISDIADSKLYKYETNDGNWYFYKEGTEFKLVGNDIDMVSIITPSAGDVIVGYHDESKTEVLTNYTIDGFGHVVSQFTELVISDSVTSIDAEAFMWSMNLQKVVIGSNVMEAYYDMFADCINISVILNHTIPNITKMNGKYILCANTDVCSGFTNKNNVYVADTTTNFDSIEFTLVDDGYVNGTYTDGTNKYLRVGEEGSYSYYINYVA